MHVEQCQSRLQAQQPFVEHSTQWQVQLIATVIITIINITVETSIKHLYYMLNLYSRSYINSIKILG